MYFSLPPFSLHFYCGTQIPKRWQSRLGIGKAHAQRHQEMFPLLQKDRSENSFLLCNRSPTTAATPGVRIWPPAKLQNSLWWCTHIAVPMTHLQRHQFSQLWFLLTLIQLTATRVGSGDSAQGKATLKDMETSVHFSKAFRVSYLML